jgi:hypothetical protein
LSGGEDRDHMSWWYGYLAIGVLVSSLTIFAKDAPPLAFSITVLLCIALWPLFIIGALARL